MLWREGRKEGRLSSQPVCSLADCYLPAHACRGPPTTVLFLEKQTEKHALVFMSIIWTTAPHSQFPIQFVVLAMLASLSRNSKLSGRISCAKHTEREAGRECQTNQTNRLFADGRRRNPAIHQFCPPSFLPFSRPERNESAHVRRARGGASRHTCREFLRETGKWSKGDRPTNREDFWGRVCGYGNEIPDLANRSRIVLKL